ncbi:ribbon-helix-helix domain-containing protein [Zavarzinia compransoris]|uniref:ribbon-helix-helix domain-containing protein n=1 Tax=Zavarzinia marina TaxID=2911065 RepID=UPI001F2EAC34|nr:ribbon-helix-helix domain-containing protein [Zavarzinia marina]MCF4164033.1 ribbon-helix-helix domain-containing protein [Zavarzinia marina]
MRVKNIRINGHRTSVRLEPSLWDAVEDICRREGISLDDLCNRVAAERPGGNYTSNLRCWVVDYFRFASAA